jgi:hypothetical protein
MIKKDTIPPNLLNPSPFNYNPSYKVLDKNIKGSLRYKQEEKYKNKSLMINKLWRSYDLFSDYNKLKLKSFINEQLS